MSDTLILLCWLTVVALLFWWTERAMQRDERQYHRDLAAAILRSRAPAGSGPTPDGVPQAPVSGRRVRVEARSAAPPLTPSALVGTAVPRPGVPTRPPAPTGTEWLPHGNSTTVPVGPQESS